MPKEKDINFGKRIKKIRLELGHTQESFANSIGVKAKNNVAHWEKGRAYPTYEQLVNIAKMSNRRILWIITGEEPEYESNIIRELDERERDLNLNKIIDENKRLKKENEELRKEKYTLITEVSKLSKVAEEIAKYNGIKYKNKK